MQDFARGKPARLALPNGWAWLEERYRRLAPVRQLTWVFDHVRDRATHVLFEHEYIDADYRNEYANFYVKVFERLPDRCERLHFWQDNTYLGFCSIRPIAGAPVGRCAVLPKDEDRPDIACLATSVAHPYGHQLSVEAFPFISQDRRYGRCAHAVIWMISQYHHLRFHNGRYFMSDIVSGASAHEFERVVPSTGLTTEQIGAAFRHIGLSALHYDLTTDKKLTDERVRLIVTSYLNSHMPLALGTPGHLTALIGAGDNEDGFYAVRSDDEVGPYCRIRPSQWTDLFVPLPDRIYLRAEEAHQVGCVQLKKVLDHEQAADVAAELDRRNWTVRCFAVEARDHKVRILARNELPAAVRAAHVRVGTPRWLWILEVVDRDAERRDEPGVIGELAIDATSGEHAAKLLFANLPHTRLRWPDDREPEIASTHDENWQCYESASALKLL